VIRACIPADAAGVCRIYNHYVENTVITFEEAPISRAEMEQRIREISSRWPWLVCDEDGVVAGYAYATAWRPRCAYRLSVESTVYLAPEFVGRGLGARLYRTLIDDLRSRDVHCIVGGIALPNPASVALHEKMGFEKVAHFREIGWKFERWIDVGYWELVL